MKSFRKFAEIDSPKNFLQKTQSSALKKDQAEARPQKKITKMAYSFPVKYSIKQLRLFLRNEMEKNKKERAGSGLERQLEFGQSAGQSEFQRSRQSQ